MFKTFVLGSTTGIIVALVAAASAPVLSGEIRCGTYAWPNYPPSCLRLTTGEALGNGAVRMATPSTPAKQAGMRIGQFAPQPMTTHQSTPPLPRDLPSQTAGEGQTVTVWREGRPTTYLVRG